LIFSTLIGFIVQKKKILVTAALPYANGPIHLGHLAGAYLPADIYVRYNRSKGNDVVFICGSDEHGVPITITAEKEKITPQDVIDRFHKINKDSFEKFGMSFDNYSRTSIPIHHETAKEFFSDFHKRGILNEKKTMQFFDEKQSMFLPDRYVEGTCPRCGNDQARSDECENCGALYEPDQLLNPISKISGTTPILRETSHWYFPLGNYQQRLEDYINAMDAKHNWKENVLQYSRGWFKDGLQDRAVTRDLDWGVQVPLDSAIGKVIYVWFEAVLGYISATKELSLQRNEPDFWKRFWLDPENTTYIPFLGKDNVVFHCIIFPAMLMAWNDGHGPDEQFVLPANVPANEFYNFEGKKFSKSRNWGIDVIDFLNKFPADPLRYTIALNLPEMRDTDFYWKEFQGRNNNELANILGNLVNRTFTFVHKNFDGKVPVQGELLPVDLAMLELNKKAPVEIGNFIEHFKIKDAVLEMMNLARAANKYFNDMEPWKTVKSDKERCGTTLNVCLQTIYTLAVVFEPLLPNSSREMLLLLSASTVPWDNAGEHQLADNLQLGEPKVLFTKIEDSVIEELLQQLGSSTEEVAVAIPKPDDSPEIAYDDFAKVKLRVATILEAEAVPKSKKLIKLQVDLGYEKRQVVAGIGETYQPQELVGKKVTMVVNLKPAKLMGVESQGMILAVENGLGKLNLMEVDSAVLNGTQVR